MQILKPELVSKTKRDFSVVGRREGRQRLRTSPTEVTFCSEPCQPEGSTLSEAKPICSRVNKKQNSSQQKLTYSFKSTCILKVIGTYCLHKTSQRFTHHHRILS